MSQKKRRRHLRYTAEVGIDDAKSKAANSARFAFQEATNAAEKELITHPVGHLQIRHFSLVCLFENLVHILELLGVPRKRLAEIVEANNTPTLFEVCLSSSPLDKVTERHIQSSLTSPLASGRDRS